MKQRIHVAILLLCTTCLSACATSDRLACRFGDPFDAQTALQPPNAAELQPQSQTAGLAGFGDASSRHGRRPPERDYQP